MAGNPESYPIPTQTLPGLQTIDHFNDLVEIQEFLNSRGIRTRNTRIERYARYLEQVTNAPEIDAQSIFKNVDDSRFRSEIDWYLYILRETHEIMWILRGLKVHLPKGIDEKLKLIVGGSDFAAQDTNTVSRNTQFELRIASYFCQSMCEVDMSKRTDIVVHSGKHTFYIECKRIAKENKLRKNIQEAKQQLRKGMPNNAGRGGVYGIIAADVTSVAFQHNGLVCGESVDLAKNHIRKKLNFISELADNTSTFSGLRNLIHCWLQIHIPICTLYPPSCLTSFSSSVICNPRQNRKSVRAIEALRTLTEDAERNDPRTVTPKNLTLRTEVTIPAGSKYYIDESLFQAFLENNISDDKFNDDDIIAELTMEGSTHEFSFLEFKMVKTSISKAKLDEYRSDLHTARLDLIMKMYIQVNRYLDSE